MGYVDNDDIPELFIIRGNYHAVGVEFYTYKEGNVIKFGNASAEVNSIFLSYDEVIYEIIDNN